MIRDDNFFQQAADRLNAQYEQFRQSMDPRLHDHARRILDGSLDNGEIDEQTAGDVWEKVHSSKSSAELAQHLMNADIPTSARDELRQAKRLYEPSALERAVEAVKSVAQLDPAVLEAAESHGTVLKHIAAALMQQSKDEK